MTDIDFCYLILYNTFSCRNWHKNMRNYQNMLTGITGMRNDKGANNYAVNRKYNIAYRRV
jgi:hypothetical protein